jgi:hypothetical protein
MYSTTSRLILGFLPVIVYSAAHAQNSAHSKCTGHLTHYSFLARLPQSCEALDHAACIDALVCIAVHDQNSPPISPIAVECLAALADNESELRAALLNIVTNAWTNRFGHQEASEILAYVADNETRQKVMSSLVAGWPSAMEGWRGGWPSARDQWRGYFSFFVELGDEAFARWLEESDRQGKMGILPVEASIAQIRIQQHPAEFLLALERGHGFEPDGLLRQALRNGVPKEQLQPVVVRALESRGSDGWPRYKLVELLRAADEMGVTLDDTEAIGAIRRGLAGVVGDPAGLQTPEWARKRVNELRLTFYARVVLQK